MGKVIKVIDLLNESTKGSNLTFRKDGESYTNSLWSFLNMYLYRKMSFEEIVRWLNSEVEILDEEQEIDIQKIHELMMANSNNDYNEYSIGANRQIINNLVKAVKQLDNKIKEK